jgi:hypothetical protein
VSSRMRTGGRPDDTAAAREYGRSRRVPQGKDRTLRHGRWAGAIATLALAGSAAACGDDGKKSAAVPQGVDGQVIFRDALDNNRNGWLQVPQTPFRGGVYIWNDMPQQLDVASAPDTLRGKQLPPGVSVKVRVEQRQGAALRMIACRESGEDGTSHHVAYELGVDGRQALIRRWHEHGQPPQVLAHKPLSVANGNAVTLNARCLTLADGKVALTLRVDGKTAVQATDDHPLPDGGIALHAIARADTDQAPTLAWDDFGLRALREKT